MCYQLLLHRPSQSSLLSQCALQTGRSPSDVAKAAAFVKSQLSSGMLCLAKMDFMWLKPVLGKTPPSVAGSEQCDTSQTWNNITDWLGETGQLLFVCKDIWRGLITWTVLAPLLFPDTWHANVDTAQRRGLALTQCVFRGQALCSASTSPVWPWECFSPHGSWMSKKYIFVSSPGRRVIFCLHS